MKQLLVCVLILVVAIGILGYWQGWFSVSKDGTVDLQVHSTKFKQDKDDFSKTVVDKAKVIKTKLANLWKKTEGLSGDDKTSMEKELADLEKKHDRLEKQIKELEDNGQDKFESIKVDLTKSLEEVEKKIDELTKKLEKGKDK
jgi:chromosome segregation ATPase